MTTTNKHSAKEVQEERDKGEPGVLFFVRTPHPCIPFSSRALTQPTPTLQHPGRHKGEGQTAPTVHLQTKLEACHVLLHDDVAGGAGLKFE